jgi:carboxyl-terminal processing protease
VLPQAGADVKASLRKGDRIARVDGKPTRNKKLDEVTKMLRGAEGSSIRLELLRTGSKQPLAVVVKRRLMRPE